MKCGEFLDWMNNCQLLKSDSAASPVLLLALSASDILVCTGVQLRLRIELLILNCVLIT